MSLDEYSTGERSFMTPKWVSEKCLLIYLAHLVGSLSSRELKVLFLCYFYSVLTLRVDRSLLSNALQCGKDKGCSDTCISESFPGIEAHSSRGL